MKYDRKSNVYPLYETYGALRQPGAFGIMGWALIVLGSLLTFSAFFSPDGTGLAVLLILGLGLLGVGVGVIKYVRNWALEFRRDEIVQHTFTKKVVRIRHRDLVSHKVVRTRYEKTLFLRGADGSRIAISTFMVSPDAIIQQIEQYK